MTLREPEPTGRKEKNTHAECDTCEAVYEKTHLGEDCSIWTSNVKCRGKVVLVEEDD